MQAACHAASVATDVIDLSELIRCYGEPPTPINTSDTPMTRDVPPGDTLTRAMLEELRGMREELAALRQEVAELRRLPAPGQLAPHPDSRSRDDEVPDAGRPPKVAATRERSSDDPPSRSFADLLDKLNARAGR